MTLGDIFKNKNVLLVGNGESIKGKGSLIDSHECVVRFNTSLGILHKFDVGIKADVWIYAQARRSVCAKIWEMKKVTPKYVIRYGESPVNFMNGIQYLIPQKYSKTVRETLGLPNGKMPSTGIVTLHLLIKSLEPKSISIIGFDGLQTSNFYTKDIGHHPCHVGEIERNFVESLGDKITVYK